MYIHTKMICTIGPAVSSLEKMMELITAGMDVARINFSHGTHEEHLQTIEKLKKVRKSSDKPVAILLDTKGPEIRIGKIKNDAIEVKPGQKLKLTKKFTGKEYEIPIHPYEVLESVAPQMRILFDDGYIITEVIEKGLEIIVEVKNAGVICSEKGVNIPDAHLNLPAMTKEDIKDIQFGCQQGIDIIAASFIRSAEHVLEIKKLLSQEKRSDILVIAKIENKEGVKNFDSIVEVADGIMVARGDLGVEVDVSLVPKLQKMMIKKSYNSSKPVVTATQMLESMIKNPRPTRAEVSDVANAIYDSTSLVMLSGETAVGKYPMQTVRQMRNIIRQAEEDFDFKDFFNHQIIGGFNDVSSAVAIAAVQTAYSADVKAIFIFTSSGFTARLVSRFRPEKPIVVLTTSESTYHQLSFFWGVIPLYVRSCKNSNEAFSIMSKCALEKRIVSLGDLVVITAGMPFGKKGSTNMMRLESIGPVLVRGYKGHGVQKKGKVFLFHYLTEECGKKDLKDKIIVLPRCDEKYLLFMKKAKGIILQNSKGDALSETFAMEQAKKLNLSLIVRADNAMSLLKEGEEILIDPEKGLVYKAQDLKMN